MRFVSRQQRMAVMASIRERLGRTKRIFGATQADRRQVAKRLLIGGAVSGAAFGTMMAARNPLVRKWAMRTGLVGGGGALASAFTTIRENLEAKRQKLAGHASFLGESGLRGLRNIPVEALVAKSVDKGFGMGESYLHRKALQHLGEIEKIGGAKLGGLQSYTTARLARRARNLHARFLPQPDNATEYAKWNMIVNAPNLAELSRHRALRTDYLNKKIDVSARALWNELQNRGELQNLLLAGQISPKTTQEFAEKRDMRGIELQATLLRIRQLALIGRGF